MYFFFKADNNNVYGVILFVTSSKSSETLFNGSATCKTSEKS